MDKSASHAVSHLPEFLEREQSASLTDEFRQEMQHYVNESLFFFNRYVLGFSDLDEMVHGASCIFTHEVMRTPYGMGLLEDPRGYFKSSCSTIGCSLHMVWSDPVAGTPYKGCNTRIVIASAKRENATNFLRMITWFVHENKFLRFLRPELYATGSEHVSKSTKQLSVKRSMGFPEPTWDTVGAESGAASRHCDGGFMDDLIHEKNYKSPTEVANAIEFAKYSSQLTGIEQSSRMFTGNQWDLYDLNNTYLKSAEVKDDIQIFSRGGTACSYCFLGRENVRAPDGTLLEHVHEKKIFPLLPMKAHAGGPMTFADLAKERRILGTRIYMAQIENETLDASILDFQLNWLNYFAIWHDDDMNPYVIFNEWPAIVPGSPEDGRKFIKRTIPLRDLRIYELVDPGLSERSTKARTAILTVGCERNGKRIFLLDCWAKAINVENVPDMIIKKYLQWKPFKIAIESVAAQRLIGSTVRRIAATEHHVRINESTIHPCFTGNAQKDDRIRASLGPIFEAGQFFIQRDMADFIDEYRKFPRSQLKDILDALSFIAQVWRTPSHFTPEEREKRKQHHRLSLMRRRLSRDSVTNY